ncbi:type II toxin-antitoxin system Phd/YefM family antitoxin [Clostridium estertheticum]|uniref:type II toxin-antitoxin system Phd/YefM family antitoxin n=1 Tax=Clostridium estertheticum TaxID=238834 RepID=UPI0035A0F6B8
MVQSNVPYIHGGDFMIVIGYSNARQNFKNYCDKATKDFETIIITRERGDNVVMLSESAYNNLMENLYIRSDPTYYNELLKSIDQLKMGKGIRKELLD